MKVFDWFKLDIIPLILFWIIILSGILGAIIYFAILGDIVGIVSVIIAVWVMIAMFQSKGEI